MCLLHCTVNFFRVFWAFLLIIIVSYKTIWGELIRLNESASELSHKSMKDIFPMKQLDAKLQMLWWSIGDVRRRDRCVSAHRDIWFYLPKTDDFFRCASWPTGVQWRIRLCHVYWLLLYQHRRRELRATILLSVMRLMSCFMVYGKQLTKNTHSSTSSLDQLLPEMNSTMAANAGVNI